MILHHKIKRIEKKKMGHPNSPVTIGKAQMIHIVTYGMWLTFINFS